MVEYYGLNFLRFLTTVLIVQERARGSTLSVGKTHVPRPTLTRAIPGIQNPTPNAAQ